MELGPHYSRNERCERIGQHYAAPTTHLRAGGPPKRADPGQRRLLALLCHELHVHEFVCLRALVLSSPPVTEATIRRWRATRPG
jgi:hypothetical protein